MKAFLFVILCVQLFFAQIVRAQIPAETQIKAYIEKHQLEQLHKLI